jgi:hypothetical protein
MALFTSAVLDNFNRAAVGSGWSNYSTAPNVQPFAINTSTRATFAASTPPNNAMYWNAGTVAANCEVFVANAGWTGANSNRIVLFARIQNAGGAAATCYCLNVNHSGGAFGYSLGLYGADPVVSGVTRGISGSGLAGQTFTIGGGERIGLRVYDRTGADGGPVGVQLEAFYASASAPTSWQKFAAYVDVDPARITAAGYVGLGGSINIGGQQQFADDFGAGSITAPTFTLNSDVIPGLTGTFLQRGPEAKNLNLPMTPFYVVKPTVLWGTHIQMMQPFTTKLAPVPVVAVPTRKIASATFPPTFDQPYVRFGAAGGGKVVGGGVSIY